jgi:hypothetical protein
LFSEMLFSRKKNLKDNKESDNFFWQYILNKNGILKIN